MTAPASGRPGAVAGQHRAEVGHPVARRPARPRPRRSARRRARPAPTRRRTARSAPPPRSWPRPCPARRRRACSGAARDAGRDRRRRARGPGVTQHTTSQASAAARVPARPAELGRQRLRGLRTRVGADARAVARRREAARRPGAVQAAADDADARRARRARARWRPPPRPRRCAAPSPRARRAASSGSLVAASERQTTPITVGSPCAAGLPGNDEIHLSIAKPPPSAGIARKSPCGGDGR